MPGRTAIDESAGAAHGPTFAGSAEGEGRGVGLGTAAVAAEMGAAVPTSNARMISNTRMYRIETVNRS